MKILILSNHIAALPAIHAFHEKGWLLGTLTFAIPADKNKMKYFCDLKGIVCYQMIDDKSFYEQLADLLNATCADLVLVFGFSKKIPSSLLQIPPLGFFNVHFSLLPAYRGPEPLFWQIKRGESFTGVTVHKMDESFDGGPILFQQRVPLFAEENFGSLNSRLSLLSVNVIDHALSKLMHGEAGLQLQDESGAFALPSVKAFDVAINWEEHTAAEIMNLVNACNPIYAGAATLFRGQEITIVEVSPAIINDMDGHEPGTVVYVDGNYGLFVACKHAGFLRINVVQTTEGILSGYKLIALGVKAGDRFTTSGQYETLS